PGRNPLSLCTAAARTRFPRVPSPGGPASSVRAGKAGLTPSAERTAQPGLCGAARNGSGDSLPRPASTGPWPRRLRLRTGICRLNSRERPRSDLQRAPFWLSWLLFRWWRRRWNPRLPGYRSWRDAHGQPRRSWPTARRWLWSSGTSWRLGHHQARSSGASGERRQAGNCSLPSTERGQSPGTETCLGRKEERSLEGGSEGQEPVWAAGGGPGKEGSRGSTCGGLLPDPREREVASLPPGPPSQAEPAARGTEQCPPCAQCGQSLGQKELSEPHQRAHHGPPPFAGAQCPKSFPQRATPHQPPSGARGRAHLHLRPVRQDLRPPVDAHTHYSAHIGEKPYECAECAKSFGRLSTLLEHWHTHTALSPMKSTKGNHDKFLIR
uniref:C2H2-type domain-containing protein n=1 Tax=Pongo abelii TaxID=9601 RepID=A0A8I5UV62_PONAB